MIPMRSFRVLVLAIGVLLGAVALAACGGGADEPAAPTSTPLPGTVIDPPRDVIDFTLTNEAGEPYGLDDLRGRASLIFFGFTNCPDICPTTLAEFTRVKAELGDAAEDVQFVFISVDGARDTPERLAEYVHAFDPGFIGLTGDDDAVRPVADDFGVYYERQEQPGSAAGYLVNHTATSFVLDRDGRLAIVFPYGTPPDVIVQRLQLLL